MDNYYKYSTLDWMIINHSKINNQVTKLTRSLDGPDGQIKTLTLYSDPKPNQNQNPNHNTNPNPNEIYDINFLDKAMSRDKKSFCL